MRAVGAARWLAVDTTGSRLGLALRDGERVWAIEGPRARPHDEALPAATERLLRRAGLELRDLDVLAAASGPGRFTGIRVGMTFVSLLARALGKPAVAVTLFQAAAALWESEGGLPPSDARAAVVFAAHGGEFFLQLFRSGKRLRPQGPPRWLRRAELAGLGPRRGLWLAGPGAEAFAREAGASGTVRPLPVPGAKHVLEAARRSWKGESGPLRALYLKPANFEKRP